MIPLTQDWVDKAEGDYTAALVLYRRRKAPNYDVACWLAQQSAEKYLKARLHESGISFPYTHDLTVLLGLVLSVEPSWISLQSDLNNLTRFAVNIRYPGVWATKLDAKESIKTCEEVRRLVRISLGV